jgi:hypothetical protein
MTQLSDGLRTGDVFYGRANSDRGTPMPSLFVKEFGAIATLDADGICVAATATAAATLAATGALVSGGVATFDVARAVSLTATGNNSTVTFTITGTDEYGAAMTEAIVGPNATTVTGVKAFKTVSSVACSAATVSAISAGSADKFGFPVRVGDKGKVLAVSVDGITETTLTLVAGFAATGTSTATTADVRGTFVPGTAANGAKRFTALLLVGDNSTKTGTYGADQA